MPSFLEGYTSYHDSVNEYCSKTFMEVVCLHPHQSMATSLHCYHLHGLSHDPVRPLPDSHGLTELVEFVEMITPSHFSKWDAMSSVVSLMIWLPLSAREVDPCWLCKAPVQRPLCPALVPGLWAHWFSRERPWVDPEEQQWGEKSVAAAGLIWCTLFYPAGISWDGKGPCSVLLPLSLSISALLYPLSIERITD